MTDYLDITSEVTDEQYRKVLDSLLKQFEDWRREHGWCTDLYLYVAQLSNTFRWDSFVRDYYTDGYSGQMKLDIPEDRTAQERATDLREIRGRILRNTRDHSEYLNMRRANGFLENAGLAPWSPPVPAKNRYYVSLGCWISSEKTAEELQDKITRSLTRAGAEKSGMSLVVEEDNPAAPSQARVPDSETVPLLPHPRHL